MICSSTGKPFLIVYFVYTRPSLDSVTSSLVRFFSVPNLSEWHLISV